MRVVVDFHIHSRFSRACSKDLTLSNIAEACGKRGIDLVATGDFTHPMWRAEIGEQLEPFADGIFRLRAPENDWASKTRFVLSTELSCIYKKGGKTRRVHHVIIFPSLEAVDHLIQQLQDAGRNLASDGRPILGMSSKELLERCLNADRRVLFIPAHAWTPWFAVFGSESGYDHLEECFDDLTPHIPAIETGLSSDPAMNWRCSMLDSVALVSGSDAHSIPKLGREATAVDVEELTFDHIARAIRASAPLRYDAHMENVIAHTIEFHPEEGKYHYDGHRACGVCCTPEQTKKYNMICPQCKKQMTIGVMHRVDKLADRKIGFVHPNAPPYKSIVPLIETIMEAFAVKSMTLRSRECYEHLVRTIGNEFYILLDAPLECIATHAPIEVTEAIRRVREGELDIAPGYDGEFGTVRIFSDKYPRPIAKQHALL
ncbi:MAG: endonuclease Q family protein [Candidatus Uhrbacteria bacterium]